LFVISSAAPDEATLFARCRRKNMSYESATQRFQKAIGILADEKGRIKERLLVAYASQLSGIDRNRDLPEPMVKDFDLLRYSLSDAEMPYGYGEHAAKKIHDLTEDEASRLARTIFSMYLSLAAAPVLEKTAV
jgi:hypothetical protein